MYKVPISATLHGANYNALPKTASHLKTVLSVLHLHAGANDMGRYLSDGYYRKFDKTNPSRRKRLILRRSIHRIIQKALQMQHLHHVST